MYCRDTTCKNYWTDLLILTTHFTGPNLPRIYFILSGICTLAPMAVTASSMISWPRGQQSAHTSHMQVLVPNCFFAYVISSLNLNLMQTLTCFHFCRKDQLQLTDWEVSMCLVGSQSSMDELLQGLSEI